MPSQYNFSPSSPFDAEQEKINRERMLAEALMQQSGQGLPSGQMAGSYYVPTHPLQHLAQALKGVNAQGRIDKAGKDSEALAERRRDALAQALGAMPRAKMEAQPTDQEGTGSFDMAGMNTPQKMVRPTMQDNAQWLAALGGVGRDAVSMGGTILGMQQKQEEGEENRQARMADRAMQLEAQAQQAGLTREARQAAAAEAAALRRELALGQQDFARQQAEAQRSFAERQAGAQRDFQAQQARQAAADRQALAQTTGAITAGNRVPVAVMGPDGKPVYVSPDQAVGRQPAGKAAAQLPTSALKEQNELIAEANIAGNIQTDLAKLDGQIATGELKLGLIRNPWNAARNWAGESTPESENYNTFRTTLERLRNDSLRLNKGVQTEGDAQRAWAELMGNINDDKVVRKRLAEIQQLNKRAESQKRMQIDVIRQNFGVEPFDASKLQSQPSGVNSSGGDAPQRRAGDDPLGLRGKRP